MRASQEADCEKSVVASNKPLAFTSAISAVDMLDVAAPLVDGRGLLGINIEAQDLVAVAIEIECQRQAHVTKAKNANTGGFVLNFFEGGRARENKE